MTFVDYDGTNFASWPPLYQLHQQLQFNSSSTLNQFPEVLIQSLHHQEAETAPSPFDPSLPSPLPFAVAASSTSEMAAITENPGVPPPFLQGVCLTASENDIHTTDSRTTTCPQLEQFERTSPRNPSNALPSYREPNAQHNLISLSPPVAISPQNAPPRPRITGLSPSSASSTFGPQSHALSQEGCPNVPGAPT